MFADYLWRFIVVFLSLNQENCKIKFHLYTLIVLLNVQGKFSNKKKRKTKTNDPLMQHHYFLIDWFLYNHFATLFVYRFSAFWLRSKCSICSYQLNIWYVPHWGTSILNWFLDIGEMSGACSALATGWPGIAVLPGSAHSPPGEKNQTKKKLPYQTHFSENFAFWNVQCYQTNTRIITVQQNIVCWTGKGCIIDKP